jgi:hypothetical protein
MAVADEADGTEVMLPALNVRLPIELSPRLHRQLLSWCRETAQVLDVPGVARGDVIESLLRYLVEDETVSAAIRARLAAGMQPPWSPRQRYPRAVADD